LTGTGGFRALNDEFAQQQLMARLQTQLGEDQYRELVKQYGEEGLLIIAARASESLDPPPQLTAHQRATDNKVWVAVLFCCLPWWLTPGEGFGLFATIRFVAARFVCFSIFALIVGAIAKTTNLDESLGIATGAGFVVIAVVYLVSVIGFWIAAASGKR
jgi:hypothetical protein